MCDPFNEYPPESRADRSLRRIPSHPRKSPRLRGSRKRDDDCAVHTFLAEYPPLLMATTAYFAMMADLISRPVEAGGVLIGPIDHDSVTHYVPDATGRATTASFTFDHEQINELLRRYVPLGLDVKGVGHSHPAGCLAPSSGDLQFVCDCFTKASPSECDRFYLPIVVGKRLFPYVVYRGDAPVTVYSQLILF